MRRSTLVVAALALAVAACGDDGGGTGGGGTGGGGSGGGESQSDGVILTVYVADEVVATWTLAQLEGAVPFVEADIDGEAQRGPGLLGVLDASGVTDWERAEVLGKGEGRSFDIGIDIEASEVDEGWILDVTNRGTLKLAAEELPREQWVRDASEIRIP